MSCAPSLVFARTGDLRRAQSLVDDLAAAHVSNTLVQSAWLPTIRAQPRLVNQKPAQAVDLLEAAKPYERGQLIGNLSYSCMIPVYLRSLFGDETGRACPGRISEAC